MQVMSWAQKCAYTILKEEIQEAAEVRVFGGIAIGAKANVAGSAIAFNEAMLTIDGRGEIVRLYGESATDLTGAANCRVLNARHLVVTSSGTIDHETYGIQSQLVVKGTTLTHLHAGLLGTFEVQSACTVPSESTRSYASAAAIMARIGGATITVGATGKLYGFCAINNGATVNVTSGGIFAAFGTNSISSANQWNVGLHVRTGTAKIGVRIGDSLSSSARTGHPIGQVGSERAIEVWADDGNAALASDSQGINCRLAIFHEQALGFAASVLRGHLRIVGANIKPNEAKAWQGVSGVVETSASPTIGDGSHWTVLTGLNGSISAAGTTVAGNAALAGLHITGKCPSSQSGEMIGILFEASAQGFEHAFGFTGVGPTDGNGLVEASGGSSSRTHKIGIWIGGGVGTRYIDVGT